MFQALQVVTVMLVAVAMALALAHALELPGKLRLDKDAYLAVQTIYYPGFTIGGIAEILGLLATLVLAFLAPRGSAAAWLSFGAFVAMTAMHAVYWLVTHPVNNFWLKDFNLKGAGAGFFALGARAPGPDGQSVDWTALRDRWEYSHVARAALGLVGLVMVVTALVLWPVSA
jgi:hypothetical protein